MPADGALGRGDQQDSAVVDGAAQVDGGAARAQYGPRPLGRRVVGETSIKGSITTLLEAAKELDPAEMAQFHRIIRDQSDHMRYLIGDLLDVARIETGSLPVDPEPADVHALVEEAQSRFLSGGAENAMNAELAEDLPLVMADRRRIVQVLSNLLSNAAGYSPEGSPILVTAVRDGGHVAVSVADRGRGIAEELLPELFRKFSRASGESPASGVDGSGLGLAICKGIVEAHGGRHQGRERRAGPGGAVHLRSAGGGVGDRRFRSAIPSRAAGNEGEGPRPGRGRRPPGAQVRPRRPDQGGLRAHRDRRPRRRAPPHG